MNNYENELTYDLPIQYKELNIYPVKMNDYMTFQMCLNIISINKNEIPDVSIIKMSYLDYIFHLINTSDVNHKNLYIYMLYNLLKITLHEDIIESFRDENGKHFLKINDNFYDGNDFDEIKKIILLQNNPDQDETQLDPNLEKALIEAEKFVNRHKKKMGSLEDQIICVLISTNLNMENIKELSIRKFVKILQRVDYKLHYEIYKTASLSGMVTFEKEIDHWMTEIKHDRFEGLIMETNQLEQKLEQVT